MVLQTFRGRRGFTLIELLVVIAIIAILIALLVPAVQKVRQAAARTQSTNNLKNIGLSFHGFHDANKRLPYNGAIAQQNTNPASGSWAYMILPYIDQAPLFNIWSITTSVPAYVCPGRGRPAVSSKGAWTDYMINVFVNSPTGAPGAADAKKTMVGITDGTSNTIFVGHGQIDPTTYSVNNNFTYSNSINTVSSNTTCRSSTAALNLADKSGGSSVNNWGGPFPQGSLMGMGDATVRLFPYGTYSGGTIGGTGVAPNWVQAASGLGCFLTPTGSESGAVMPDA